MQSDPLRPHADLKGVPVHDSENVPVGFVFGVLTDADTGLVRFLDVEVSGRSRHVLIPVGHTRIVQHIDLNETRVKLRAAKVADLEAIPTFARESDWPTPEAQGAVLKAFGKILRGDRYYAHPAFDHSGLYAGQHPIVVTEPDAEEDSGLQLLSRSRVLQVASGNPDIVGWQFRGSDLESGTVSDLIVDPENQVVRYVVVDTDAGQRMIPIGYVHLDEAAEYVHSPGLTRADIAGLPAFEGIPISRADEEALLEAVEVALDARNPFYRVEFSSHAEMIDESMT